MRAPARPNAGGPGNGDRSSLHRFVDALSSAAVWHRVRGDHVDFRCPLPEHEDRSASGSADWRPAAGDRPGSVRFKCYACGQECNDAIISVLGLSWGDLFDDPPARPPASSRRARSTGPVRAVSRGAGGAPTRTAKVDKSIAPPKWRGQLAATYPYINAAGELVAEFRRYESSEVNPATGKPRKRFSWRYRGHAGGWVYRAPAECPLYRLPDLLAARTKDPAPVVWLVEGEKNADDLARAGVLAVSAPNGAKTTWQPEYTEVLAGTHVVIVADRDEPGVARAEEVGQALAAVTASLCAVRTPIDEPKADASDHLKAGLGLDRFELLPIAAAHGAPVVPGGGQPIPEREGEVVPFRRPAPGDDRDTGREKGGGRDGGSGGDGGDGDGEARPRIVRDQYAQVELNGGAVVEVKQVAVRGGRSEELLIELLDARVRIVRRISLDTGDGVARTTHVDLVATRDGQTVELTRVPWDEFRKGAYLDRLPWPVTWRDTPQGRSTLANAITRTSGPVLVVPAYSSLGWREVEGRWTYVHAAGGINAEGSVPEIVVEAHSRLSGFTLPSPPASGAEFANALRGVLAVLEGLPQRIAAPVMGAALRALVGGQPHTSVFAVGPPGSIKTGVAALAQQLSYPAARHDRLSTGAGEDAMTITAMEELMWQAGDMLLVADDLAPDRGAERAAARANELLRKVGNGVAKGRSTRTGGLREDRQPRTLLMLTGEDGASSPSAESRTVYVPFALGDIDLAVIKALSKQELIKGRNQTAAAMVRYLAERFPVTEWAEEMRNTYSMKLLEATHASSDLDGIAARRADKTAELAVGWRALLDAAVAGGALGEVEADKVWERAWNGLVECLAGQVEVVERRGTAERAADLLRSVLRSGRGHLESEAGGAPAADRLRACGWRRDEGQFGDIRPGGDAVGWITNDRRHVWLDTGAAFSAIERQGRAESNPLGVTPRALTTALVAAKVLSTEPVVGRRKPVPQVRRYAGGVRQRVWELPWSWLWPDDADGAPPVPGGSDDEPPPPPADPDGGPDPTHPAGDEGDTVTAPKTRAEGAAEQAATGALSKAQGGAGEGSAGRLSGRQPLQIHASEGRYRAPGVIVDAGTARLIGGDAIQLPAEIDTVPALVSWARGLNLGLEHARSRDDAGQIWLMPTLARRFGLNKAPDSGLSRATATHPVVKALTGAGWNLGNRGLQAWTHLWRDQEASLHLVVVPWLSDDALCPPKNPPTVKALSDRLELFSGLVNSPTGERQPYLYSVGGTGTALLKLCRATATTDRLKPIDPPPPAVEAYGKRWEVEWSWQRGPTDDERARRYVIGWDANAQYLAAAASVTLGLGEARHLENVPELGKKLPPGYWCVARPTHPLESPLPDLLNPAGAESEEHVWITTPTLTVAREHGLDLRPQEAWIWDSHTTWLQSWAHSLRDARYALTGAIDADPYDEDLRAVMKAVKLTYAAGIGMLGSKEWREGSATYRPDARHHLIALAKANLFRKMAKAAGADCAPLGVHRDVVLFATDSDDPNQGPPPGFKRGTKLGEVKCEGITTMDNIADALAESNQPSGESFGFLND